MLMLMLMAAASRCQQFPRNVAGERAEPSLVDLSKTFRNFIIIIPNPVSPVSAFSAALTHTQRGLCSTVPSRSPLSVSGPAGISCLEQEQKVAQDGCSFLPWHTLRAPAGAERWDRVSIT